MNNTHSTVRIGSNSAGKHKVKHLIYLKVHVSFPILFKNNDYQGKILVGDIHIGTEILKKGPEKMWAFSRTEEEGEESDFKLNIPNSH